MTMFYLIPFDFNTSAFTQVLLPSQSIGTVVLPSLGQINFLTEISLPHFLYFISDFLRASVENH